jgi:DNA-binding GntR family transcriptional regulator
MRIVHESISDQICRLLREDLIAGRLRPGDRIVEERIARELGVSKTPLRLALHQLKRDGLVQVKARSGIYVATPSLTEVLELMELRAVLEGLAAARMARTGRKAEYLAHMKALLAGFSENSLNDNRLDFTAADLQFHRLLVLGSRSRELISTTENISLRLHLNRLRKTQSDQHDLRVVHREHLAIVAAIEVGDAALAESLVRDHIRSISVREISQLPENELAEQRP